MQNRHHDGRFAPEARAEADIDLGTPPTRASADAAPRPDWPASCWAQYPATASYGDLPALVSETDPHAHATSDAWVKQQTAVLVRSYDLGRGAYPTSPAEFADMLDWDDDETDERDGEEATYAELADALRDEPWTVPPVLAVEHADGSVRLLDGNHRAGLVLWLGHTSHPAYVITEPPGAECATCRDRAEVAALFGR